jgi:hypothetical protein
VSSEKRVRNIRRDKWKTASADTAPTRKKAPAIRSAKKKRILSSLNKKQHPAKSARTIAGKYAGPTAENRRRGANRNRSHTPQINPHAMESVAAVIAKETPLGGEGIMVYGLTDNR